MDSFKDIPRLPGERAERDVSVLEWYDVEEWTWVYIPELNADPARPSPNTSSPIARPSPIDDLHLTDQELDGILELKGEI